MVPDDPNGGSGGTAIVVSHGPPSAAPALLRPILARGVDGILAQVTVIDVPLAEAMKVGEDVGATVNAAVAEDPAKDAPGISTGNRVIPHRRISRIALPTC